MGYLLVVSTNPNEMGKEKNIAKFNSSLSTFSYNSQLKRVATAGDDGVRVIDMRDFKEIRNDFVSTDKFGKKIRRLGNYTG